MPDGVAQELAPDAEGRVTYVARKQFISFHNRKQRWSIGVAHRRAGKTLAHLLELIKGANTCKLLRPRFAYIAPLHSQAKSISWDYLKYYGMAIPGSTANEAELRVDFPNGGRVRLFGADNPDSLRGPYLDGVVLDEYAQMREQVWPEVIRPQLADRTGWGAFIGTPKGRNAFCRMYEAALLDPEWYTFMLRASETGILSEAELADIRKPNVTTPEQYAQEFECSFEAAILGAYYGKLMTVALEEGRIDEVPYNPSLPVETWWDIGYRDANAIWFAQRYPSGMTHLIDAYQMTGMTAPHFSKIVNEKPYNYSRHVLPHDVAEVDWSGDGRSRAEVLGKMLKAPIESSANAPVEEGINAARLLIPMCRFDAVKCAVAIEALRQYRADYDEKMNVLRPKPRHDEHSHYADAFRYGAVSDAPSGDWSKPLAYRPVTTVV